MLLDPIISLSSIYPKEIITHASTDLFKDSPWGTQCMKANRNNIQLIKLINWGNIGL